jgi:Fe2+ or Zn2+ uptake regulation protein
MEAIALSKTRQTKYATAVVKVLQDLKHATNAELHQRLQLLYPEVSATTIHRVTARLKQQGEIGCAPKPADGSERYDISAQPHHHFMCAQCSAVCDVPETAEAQNVIHQLKDLSKLCAIPGTLTLSGVCKKCSKEDKS